MAGRWSVINIFEPKYSTNEVLIKTTRVVDRNKIIIEQGAYRGEYFGAGEMIKSCPIKSMKTKRGNSINMYRVPLRDLERL